MKRTLLLLFALLAATPLAALAGGGPQNVLVVANGKDADSVRIAEHYAKARGIPPLNVLTIHAPTGLRTDFETYRSRIQEPIRSHLLSTGLVDHVDYIVFTRGFPIVTSVPGGNAAVAACIMVMDTPLSGARQVMPVGEGVATRNPLNQIQPEAFTHAKEYRGYRLYLSTFLTGYTAKDSMALVDRAIAAERSPPADPLFVFQDANGNARLRNQFYDRAIGQLNAVGLRVERHPAGPDAVTGRKRLMGYMSGGSYSKLTEKGIASNTYPPGAIADMLESFGAVPQNFTPGKKSQVPVTWFVKHGITGVHGAVSEPFAHVFPDALLFQRYVAGMNLGKAFHFSLPFLYWRNLVIGDPLCTPFARRPKVRIDGLPSGTAAGEIDLTVRGEGPVRVLKLFVDGREVGEVKDRLEAGFKFDTTRMADGPHHVLAVEILTGPLAIQGWTAATVDVKNPTVRLLSARRGPSGTVIVTTSRKVSPDGMTAKIDGVLAQSIETWDDTGALKIVPAKPLPAGRVVVVELGGAATGNLDYPVPPARFAVDAPARATAGEEVTIRVRALDAAGATAKAYRGQVTVSNEATSLDLTTVAAKAPEISIGVRIVKAGTVRLKIHDRMTDTEGFARVTVEPGPPVSFTADPGNCPVGEEFDLEVALFDQYGNLATNYEGEIGLRFPADLSAISPDPVPVGKGKARFRDLLLTKPGRNLVVVVDRSGRSVARGMLHVKVFAQRAWLVTGPVKGTLDTDALGPAAGIRPSEGHVESDRLWRAWSSPRDEVDLRAALGRGTGVSHAHVYVFAPKDVKVRLHLGWGARLRLSVDGTEVFRSKKEEKKTEADRQKIKDFALARGWHRVLVTIEHGGASDQFVFRISGAGGMKTSLSEPGRPGRVEGEVLSSGAGMDGVEVLLTGPGRVRTRTGPDGSFRVGGLAAGTWTVTPVAKGLTSDPASREIEVGREPVTGLTFAVEDRVAPTVTIESPEDGTKTGATVKIEVAAKDNVAVTGVTLRLDGARLGSPLTAPPFEFPLSAEDAGYRTVRVTVVAEDAAGNRTESEAIRVKFFRDRKGPDVRIVNPAGRRMKAGKTTLIAEVTDDSGVLSVEFQIDGKLVGKAPSKGPFEVSWDAKKGTHSLVVTAIDALGNETKKSVKFRVR